MSHTNNTTDLAQTAGSELSNSKDKAKKPDTSSPKEPDKTPSVADTSSPSKTTEPTPTTGVTKATDTPTQTEVPKVAEASNSATASDATPAPTQTADESTVADTKPSPVVLKALVTDDNYFNRDIFKVALEDIGFFVEEAPNGRTCLNFLEKETFDLLVLDLQMPDLNGLEILRRLSQEKVDKMSILVITANPHMITEEVEEKADFTMQKPVDVADFSNFAKRIMDRIRN